MKINFTLWDTSLSGGTRVVFEIASRLQKKGHEISLVAVRGNHNWRNLGIPIKYLDASKTLFSIYKRTFSERIGAQKSLCPVDTGPIRRLAAHLSDRTFSLPLAKSIPDCNANFATWYATALPVWKSNKGKAYYLMQDFPQLVVEAGGACGLRMFEETLKLPFYFLTPSAYTKDLVLRHQPAANVNVIGAGVDCDVFSPRSKETLRKGKKTLMAILRGTKFKGDEIVIKSLNIVNKKCPVHAILVGSGNILSGVKPEFSYTLFDSVSESKLSRLYSSADAFIFASYAEGFGLPPLEAMACGTPVVTTCCGGNRDYAIDGQNCLMVRPGDVEGISKCTVRIVTDENLTDRLKAGGIETAKRYTWDRVMEKVEESLKEGV